MKRYLSTVMMVIFLFVTINSQAATVHLQNGDRISGTFRNFTEESVTLETVYGETTKISLDKVTELETTEPITFKLTDGRYFTGILTRIASSTMVLKSNGDTILESIRMADVERFFSEDPRESLRDELEVKLSGNINGSADWQSGNNDMQAYHLDASARARTPRNRYTIGIQLNQESIDQQLEEKNVLTFAKYDHFVGNQWFLFSSTTLEHDKFEGLDLRSNISTGLGYQFLENETQFLLFELGASYTNETYTTSAPSVNYFGTRYSLDYEQQLINAIRFFHFQEGIQGTGEEGDFNFRSQTGFRFPIAKGFQSTLQYNFDWDEDPTADNVKTDRQYLFSIGYSF